MSPRINKAIVELEKAIRAESHPQAYLFEMRITPSTGDFTFHHASNGFSSERYNLRREDIKTMESENKQ